MEAPDARYSAYDWGCAGIAQLVEQLLRKQLVGGSSPLSGTSFILHPSLPAPRLQLTSLYRAIQETLRHDTIIFQVAVRGTMDLPVIARYFSEITHS